MTVSGGTSRPGGRAGRRALPALCAALVFASCSGSSEDVVCTREPTEVEEGLVIHDTRCGEGEPAARGDVVSVTYSGSIEGEGEFESIDDPYRFRLGVGQVIEGWDEGLQGMQRGGVRVLTIPPALGYGDVGLDPAIPPDATLVYEIELVSREEPED